MYREGRHKGGYKVKTLFSFGMDMHFIKYAPFTHIPPHKDPTDGRHLRLNIVLKGRGQGVFTCEKTIIHNKYLTLFRPDLYTHSFSNKHKERLVLSIGIVI